MKIYLKTSVMLVTALTLMVSCKKNTNTKKEENTLGEKLPEKGTTLCKAIWFPHSQTPAPLEGKGSPFDVKSSTNHIFHQWSWQKFLWLTKPTNSTKGETIPLFLNSNDIFQVDAHLYKTQRYDEATVFLNDTVQAGSGAALKTNPKYNQLNKSHTVFYSIHVNDIFLNAAKSFKEEILAKRIGLDNTASFPVGAFELKVSWVSTEAIAEKDRQNYYITKAVINKSSGDYKLTEVALLGMHVVGIVENHPEFIWATFEHADLGPDYNWKKGNAYANDEKLLFTAGETSGLDGITWEKATRRAKEENKAYHLFEYGVPRYTQGARLGELMNSSQSEPRNYNNIKEINRCVRQNLRDVWKNYFYNGSIWINTDGLSPKHQVEKIVELGECIANGGKGSAARGSLNCANITMETYTQTFQNSFSKINASDLANCFSCHNALNFQTTDKNKSPLYLSHVFNGYLIREQGKTYEEVELLKAKHELETFIKKSL